MSPVEVRGSTACNGYPTQLLRPERSVYSRAELGVRRTRNPAHLAQQHPRNCESPSAGCPMAGRQIGGTPRRLLGSLALLALPRPVIVLRPAPSPLRRLQAEVRCRPMVADGARTRPRASAGERAPSRCGVGHGGSTTVCCGCHRLDWPPRLTSFGRQCCPSRAGVSLPTVRLWKANPPQRRDAHSTD